MTDWYSQLTPLDFHYFAVSTNIFLYGYLTMMCIGFFGNLCQIVTFSRKTMRHVSTGVFFLALSISDFIYLLLHFHIVIVYGLGHPDRSDLNHTCRLRHFLNYLTTNFSAWILTISKILFRFFKFLFDSLSLSVFKFQQIVGFELDFLSKLNIFVRLV